ncbi:MAG: AAA family ATPase [Lachnospiraceae bacterium]|nr:AAA family ATPase [Lachnospiraceae bacterium]
MARTVAIGIQDFEQMIEGGCFYVDKTYFIKEWWESKDSVTLITRPRRFGKTLTMSMLEHFFSIGCAGQGALFENLMIWQEQKYRDLQGTYPVISLSFASVKESDYQGLKQRIYQILTDVYQRYRFVRDSDALTEIDREYFDRISINMSESDAAYALHKLSEFLNRYYGKKVIILLDEYDTPMQEAYINGYWDEIVNFTRNFFNAAFKTNPYLDRAIMTGITRVSKESIFSDLNNLKVVTATSDEYQDVFGFTEEEVFAGMDEQGLDQKDEVKKWYDGFTFGKAKDIYNPWSILNFLDTGKIGIYWANTSSNSLVGKLIREGSPDVKVVMEELLKGETFHTVIDEQIIFEQLGYRTSALWSLLLASGYLKVEHYEFNIEKRKPEYDLKLTNLEVQCMFERMIDDWFLEYTPHYNRFIKALLAGDLKEMNIYMNKVALNTISYFDTGNRPSGSEPERFYHGLVLGLLVELSDRYTVTSNRESGYGRYDVILEPRKKGCPAIIMEFKVLDREEEKSLPETVDAAIKQIEKKQYAQVLIDKGVAAEHIHKYGFAFEGKNVLIGENTL